MARNNGLGSLLASLQQQDEKPAPLINYYAPESDKRYTEAITALARIRRLNVPLVLAQVNITSEKQTFQNLFCHGI